MTPLNSAGVDVSLVCEEWMTWWSKPKPASNWQHGITGQFGGSCSGPLLRKSWTNVPAVTELLFCLPAANGRLERVLSRMKLIKTNRRSCLSRDALDHLMRINAQGPLLSKFDAAAAVNRWWKAKQRRLGGKEMYSTPASASAAAPGSVSLDLDQWDAWVNE